MRSGAAAAAAGIIKLCSLHVDDAVQINRRARCNARIVIVRPVLINEDVAPGAARGSVERQLLSLLDFSPDDPLAIKELNSLRK